jgi:hypothetical protein
MRPTDKKLVRKQQVMTPDKLAGLAQINAWLDAHPDEKAKNEEIGKGHSDISRMPK